jgi:predicted nucleotidyltransferase
MRDFVEKDLIFMTLAGSHMYGMSTPQSDIDKRGVCIPPRNVVMGFFGGFEQQDYSNEDTVVYGLTKFMKLASDCNPNIIELLFAPEDAIIMQHPIWDKLLERREEFLSSKTYHTFTGYALSQLKRIRTHRAWLLNPPDHKPTRAEYGLTEAGAGVRELAKGIDMAEISKDAMKVIEREKQYKAASTTWTQFQTWKKHRNPKRAGLEAQHGYDTKHASHLVRLLRMGKEILTKGTLTVRRPDAGELLAIRRGIWSYDELMSNVEPLQEELRSIYENKTYVVPDKVNKQKISDFCVELHEDYWSRKA